MTTDVTIADDLWEESSSGVISAWLFDNSDTVAKGDVLAEILVEKVMHELLAPAAGELKILVPAEDETINKGDKVAEIL